MIVFADFFMTQYILLLLLLYLDLKRKNSSDSSKQISITTAKSMNTVKKQGFFCLYKELRLYM